MPNETDKDLPEDETIRDQLPMPLEDSKSISDVLPTKQGSLRWRKFCAGQVEVLMAQYNWDKPADPDLYVQSMVMVFKDETREIITKAVDPKTGFAGRGYKRLPGPPEANELFAILRQEKAKKEEDWVPFYDAKIWPRVGADTFVAAGQPTYQALLKLHNETRGRYSFRGRRDYFWGNSVTRSAEHGIWVPKAWYDAEAAKPEEPRVKWDDAKWQQHRDFLASLKNRPDPLKRAPSPPPPSVEPEKSDSRAHESPPPEEQVPIEAYEDAFSMEDASEEDIVLSST